MTSKKPYFPNNWQKWKDAPDDVFKTVTYEEFNDWKVCSWELPDSVACIIRSQDKVTGKTEEFVYQSQKAAGKRIEKLIQNENNEITICGHDEIHLLTYGDIDLGPDFEE